MKIEILSKRLFGWSKERDKLISCFQTKLPYLSYLTASCVKVPNAHGRSPPHPTQPPNAFSPVMPTSLTIPLSLLVLSLF